MKTTFMQDFRRFFFRGLAAVLPTILTLAIIVWVFKQIHHYVGRYVNIAVTYLIALVQTVRAAPANSDGALQARWHELQSGLWDPYFWWVGFLVAIVGVYIFGRFVGSIFGRWLFRLMEAGFFRLQIMKAVYPHIKQVTEFLLAERKIPSSRVVAVEYPRKGIWSVGLVTSAGMRTLQESLASEMVTVFVPSSPTPITGYTITVRSDEIIELPLTIDEALKFTVSGGVIVPMGQQSSREAILTGSTGPRKEYLA